MILNRRDLNKVISHIRLICGVLSGQFLLPGTFVAPTECDKILLVSSPLRRSYLRPRSTGHKLRGRQIFNKLEPVSIMGERRNKRIIHIQRIKLLADIILHDTFTNCLFVSGKHSSPQGPREFVTVSTKGRSRKVDPPPTVSRPRPSNRTQIRRESFWVVPCELHFWEAIVEVSSIIGKYDGKPQSRVESPQTLQRGWHLSFMSGFYNWLNKPQGTDYLPSTGPLVDKPLVTQRNLRSSEEVFN